MPLYLPNGTAMPAAILAQDRKWSQDHLSSVSEEKKQLTHKVHQISCIHLGYTLSPYTKSTTYKLGSVGWRVYPHHLSVHRLSAVRRGGNTNNFVDCKMTPHGVNAQEPVQALQGGIEGNPFEANDLNELNAADVPQEDQVPYFNSSEHQISRQ